LEVLHGICATIPCIEGNFKQYAGVNVFITYTPTSAYIQDSYKPSEQFKFRTITLADGTTCYWNSHCPWNSNFRTTLPVIGGYGSTSLFTTQNEVFNILLNAYYK